MRAAMKCILLFILAWVAMPVAYAASSPRNLMIQVRIDANNHQSGQGADVHVDDAALRGRSYDSQHSGSSSSVQQVMVMDGAQAFVNVGQSVVVPMHQVLVSPLGAVVSDTVLIRDLGTGFYAKPTLKGNRVVLEISAYQDTERESALSVNTTRISTTIAGTLGEWMRLGGSSAQEGDSRGGAGTYSTRAGSADRQIWLKVDATP
jgi:hypothetical protein